MSRADPTTSARRSPLRHWHKNNRAIFTMIGSSSVVESYESKDGSISERRQAKELAICDLSTLPIIVKIALLFLCQCLRGLRRAEVVGSALDMIRVPAEVIWDRKKVVLLQ
jgi:hypothetical protein